MSIATEQVITRLADIERRLDRLGSARLLSPPIGNADIDADADIVVSKLYAGGSANRIVRTSNGTTMVLGQLLAADVTANSLTEAEIAASAIHSSSTQANHSGGAVVATGGVQTVPGSSLGLTTGLNTLGIVCAAMTRFTASVNGTILTAYISINGGLSQEMGTLTLHDGGWHYTLCTTCHFNVAASTGYTFRIDYVANAGTITFGNGWTQLQEVKR